MKGRETMEQYQVTGMSCAACSARVEKAVSSVEGVTSCSVSLLTNSMGVEGTADSSVIIKAVEDAGYGAKKKGVQTQSNSSDADLLKDRETPVLKKRLITSLCFLIPLMYLSMGHMMWNWPIPKILDGNHVAMGLIQLLFTTIIMVINQKFFISGFKSLFHKAPNMDTLVALGSAASYGYSVYILFAMTDAQMHQNMDAVMKYMHEFYFESAAMILTLITVGKMLEARSKGKTTDALKSLMKLAPKTAVVIRNEQEIEVGIEQVHQGDIFVVKPGENIPVDGIIIEGNSALNESALRSACLPPSQAPLCHCTLLGRLPIGPRAPLEASVTLLEATTPVKLPTKQCPHNSELDLRQPKGRISRMAPRCLATPLRSLRPILHIG